MRKSSCTVCARSIGWVGLVVSLVMMVMKAFVGLLGGSQAMLADAMYSLKDMLNALTVIIGMTVSSKPLDADHPYGHGKIEFLLSMVVSILFLSLTVYLMIHAISLLFHSESHMTPHLIVLWAALVSVGVNFGLYMYSHCVADETNSPIIRTMAQHHHGDATASGAVALGIIGAHYMNMPWIDTAVALWETVDLLILGKGIFMDSYRGLMDHSVSPAMCTKIVRAAEEVKGVKGVEHLRARYVGQDIWADMIVAVEPDVTVEQAHNISENVRSAVCRQIRHIASLHVAADAWEGDGEIVTTYSQEPLDYEEAMLIKAEG